MMWSEAKPIVVGGWASVEVIVEEETEVIVVLGLGFRKGRVEVSLLRIYQKVVVSTLKSMTELPSSNLSKGSRLLRYGDTMMIIVFRVSAAVDNYFELIIPAIDILKILA